MSRPASYDDGLPPLPEEATLYDLFFDIPHPAASSQDVKISNDRARMIEPPIIRNSLILSEMYEPNNIFRIARFAFPEHDDQEYAASLSFKSALRACIEKSCSNKLERCGNLNKYDFYLHEFTSQVHTFALQLSDGITRLHGHVLRYLPPRQESKGRSDCGRRGSRAMVLLTRATGGHKFYASVLKSVEAVMMKGDGSSISSPNDWEDLTQESAVNFLHGLYYAHAKRYQSKSSDMALYGPETLTDDDTFLFLTNIEYQTIADSSNKKNQQEQEARQRRARRGSAQRIASQQTSHKSYLPQLLPGDFIKFQLPRSLQAGYCTGGTPEDIDAPILPLLRCLGPVNTMRLLSALLCERRILLVSSSISTLSICGQAASAILSQGLLIWQHIHIPVLPPHLLKYLAAQTPYLVGLLERYIIDVEHVPGLRDVLCIHLDKNQVRTFNMVNPAKLVPNILAKRKRHEPNSSCDKPKKSSSSNEPLNIAELLSNDIDLILKAEKRIFGDFAIERRSSSEVTGGDSTDHHNHNDEENHDDGGKVLKNSGWFKGNKSEYGEIDEFPISTIFAQLMRGEGKLGIESEDYFKNLEPPSTRAVGYSSSEMEMLGRCGGSDSDPGDAIRDSNSILLGDSLGTFDVCDNERGEEEIRAALVSFFLVMYGDLGAILSENPSDGSLWLNRRKYLLCKKKDGNNDSSPMFQLYKAFSGSTMLEFYLQEKISEFERDREILIPRHRPLFALCEKHLRLKGIEYTIPNVRKVVSKTVLSCPTHHIVERSELGRARALALTSSQPYEGNISQALYQLMNDCRECNVSLTQVMAVVWSRMDDRKSSGWKHPLLALHLLKNLLLHGPITAIAMAMDGIDKLRYLQNYNATKNNENKLEIRTSAKQVWEMLVDRTRLFLRRRRAVAIRTKIIEMKGNTDESRKKASEYVKRKLTLLSEFGKIHMLMRPCKNAVPASMTKSDQEHFSQSSGAGDSECTDAIYSNMEGSDISNKTHERRIGSRSANLSRANGIVNQGTRRLGNKEHATKCSKSSRCLTSNAVKNVTSKSIHCNPGMQRVVGQEAEKSRKKPSKPNSEEQGRLRRKPLSNEKQLQKLSQSGVPLARKKEIPEDAPQRRRNSGESAPKRKSSGEDSGRRKSEDSPRRRNSLEGPRKGSGEEARAHRGSWVETQKPDHCKARDRREPPPDSDRNGIRKTTSMNTSQAQAMQMVEEKKQETVDSGTVRKVGRSVGRMRRASTGSG